MVAGRALWAAGALTSVAGSPLAGRVGLESAVHDAPLYPHHPARLEVAVGVGPAQILSLDSPSAELGPDENMPIGPRPLAICSGLVAMLN